MLIQIRCSEHAVGPILRAIAPYAPDDQIAILREVEIARPATPEQEEQDMQLASDIATKMRSRLDDSEYTSVLRGILFGSDTMTMTRGETDNFYRGKVAGLSKLLRSLFPNDASPLERLAAKKKEYDVAGTYLTTRYIPTHLGVLVRGLLATELGLKNAKQ